LPTAANVRTANGAFGQDGIGVTPTLGDCAADGSIGCVAVAAFKAVDMTKLVTGNIRYEDDWGGKQPIDKFLKGFIATRALKI
jgi:hypothetical protein